VLNLGHPFGPFVNEAALARGAEVHRWCCAEDSGEPYTIDEALQGYADAWKAFSYQFTPSWTHMEHVFDTGDGGFHGILDRAGSLRGTDTVLEIKTGEGGGQPRTPIQLAAYTMALHPRRFPEIQRVEVRLSRSGKYKVLIHSDPKNFIDWVRLLETALGDNHGRNPRTSDPDRTGPDDPHADTARDH
jgi:hypothetical protein